MEDEIEWPVVAAERTTLDVSLRSDQSGPLEEGLAAASREQCLSRARDLLDRSSAYVMIAATTDPEGAAKEGVDLDAYAFSIETVGSISAEGSTVVELLYQTAAYAFDRLAALGEVPAPAAAIGVMERFLAERLTEPMEDGE